MRHVISSRLNLSALAVFYSRTGLTKVIHISADDLAFFLSFFLAGTEAEAYTRPSVRYFRCLSLTESLEHGLDSSACTFIKKNHTNKDIAWGNVANVATFSFYCLFCSEITTLINSFIQSLIKLFANFNAKEKKKTENRINVDSTRRCGQKIKDKTVC